MEHKNVIKEIGGSFINKMLWVAANANNPHFEEYFNDFSAKYWKLLFPDISGDDIEYHVKNKELFRLLYKNNKLGFIAEVRIPDIRDVSFKDNGDVLGYNLSYGIQNIVWIYTDTIEQLVKEVVNATNKSLNDSINHAKELNSEKEYLIFRHNSQ